MHILVVEDDDDIATLLTLHLQSHAHRVTHCTHGSRALELLDKDHVDLVILDLMLPDMHGTEVCKTIRKTNVHIPIIMLTSLSSETDRVLGLELGADDYISKPFSIRELMARVKAQLRRQENTKLPKDEPEQNDVDAIRCGELLINASKHECFFYGETLDLTIKEFELLHFLSVNVGRPYSRDQLLSSVWGYQYNGYQHTINTHINRLRRKLSKINNDVEYIQTVWGIGYKLSDQVGS